MTALPSFVDLMSSLGLEQEPHPPLSLPKSPRSPPSTPPDSPISDRHPTSPRSRRDATQNKQGSRRFSPYSPALRRGNLSSKSTPEPEQRDQKHRRQSKELLEPESDPSCGLTADSSDTSSDLNVDAPISIYVRKRRSGGCLTSLTYREWNSDTGILLPCIPVMPPLLLDELYTAFDGENSPADGASAELDGYQDGDLASNRPRQRTGLRLSMPY
ncbi:hypothetical protein JOM56_008437 [Amanita muscaria]